MAVSGIIYRRFIVNDKGVEKSYVGQTCDPIKRNNDFLNLKVKYSGVRIENARKKYRPENFRYEVLETISCDTEQELTAKLNEREIYWVRKFDSFNNGYNNAKGGSGATGYRHTEEYKQWQSKQSKILNSDPEIKKRQKEGMRKYFNSPGAREKRSVELQIRYKDPAEREKLSKAQKLSYASDPLRAKTRNAHLSATCSTPEGRKRMSKTSRDAWQNEDYKAKQQERMRRQWADPEYKAAFKERNKGMNGKRVRQLSMDGKQIIAEFISACDAARAIGVPNSFSNICRVCRGDRLSYKGYKWEYIENE